MLSIEERQSSLVRTRPHTIQSSDDRSFKNSTIYNIDLWKEFLAKGILNEKLKMHKNNSRGYHTHMIKIANPANAAKMLNILKELRGEIKFAENDLKKLKEIFKDNKKIIDIVDSKLQDYQRMRAAQKYDYDYKVAEDAQFSDETIYNVNYWANFLEKGVLEQKLRMHKSRSKDYNTQMSTMAEPVIVANMLNALEHVVFRTPLEQKDCKLLLKIFKDSSEITEIVEQQLESYRYMKAWDSRESTQEVLSQYYRETIETDSVSDDDCGEPSSVPRRKQNDFDHTVYLAVVDEEAAAVLAEQMNDAATVKSKQIIIIDRDRDNGGCHIDSANPKSSRLFQKTPDYYHDSVSQSLQQTLPRDVAQLEKPLMRKIAKTKNRIKTILLQQKRKVLKTTAA